MGNFVGFEESSDSGRRWVSGNVEDIYELSPLQQGMLLHSLYDGAADMYLSQHTFIVTGPLDVDALLEAWHDAATVHPVLRTSFHWEGLDKPLQVVHRELALPAARHDWSDQDEVQQDESIDKLRAQEQAAGFDPAVAPLQRLNVIRLAADRHAVVWTYHHILIDGWSIAVFLDWVMMRYRHLTVGTPSPPPAPPFRAYIAWLQRQDLNAAREFWTSRLAGMTDAPLLGLRPDDPLSGTGEVERRRLPMPVDLISALQETAARHRVTLGTVIQAAWAVTLYHLTGRAEIVFGCASSGRPPELPRIEAMVGLFANTLPVPVAIPGDDADLGEWLHGIQNDYAAMRRYEYSPLSDIKRWAGKPGQQMFDSLLVLENYSVTAGAEAQVGDYMALTTRSVFDKIDVPLTLTFTPEPPEKQLLLHLGRFAPGYSDHVVGLVDTVLAAMLTADHVGQIVTAPGPRPTSIPSQTATGSDDAQPAALPQDPHPREDEIRAVFAEILEVPEVGPNASFFELGGDSFAAVRAIGRIEGATIGMLAAHPSARALAHAMEAPAGSDSLLRPLTAPKTAAHTLVCVPFGGGSVVSYQPLAAALSPRFALYAVALPGHEPGDDSQLRPVEDVARECAREILESIPGPVSVYGHSTGVAVAVELTRLLEAAGRRVDRLFVAASYPFYGRGWADAMVARGVESDQVVRAAAAHDLTAGRRYFSRQWPRRGTAAPLAAPITFIAGAEDSATRGYERDYRRWEGFGSALRVECVPHAGHYFHQQEPTALATIIASAVN
jgi:surfactin synthase thioesterase subunit